MNRIRYAAGVTAAVGVLAYGLLSGLATRPVMAGAATPGVSRDAQTVAGTPAQAAPADPGAASYAKHCSICHGDQREGILPAFPPLLGIKRRMSDQQLIDLIHAGKGRMPGFTQLNGPEMDALLKYLGTAEAVAPVVTAGNGLNVPHGGAQLTGLALAGNGLFQQNCAFCHGRDAMGGETGPDLTQSKLVAEDVGGDKISQVVREGRIEKKMPAFNFSSQELLSLTEFIHARVKAAAAMKGNRRGVDVADLQTGNAQAGKAYFTGAGGCVRCHSATGDLAGVATRYQGLRLMERMLYPRDAQDKVTVTLPSGKTIEGTVAYQDEFTIGVKDAGGIYRSWPVKKVKLKIDSPVQAHIDQFPKYTDDDVHNLMAYLQTLR